MKDKEIFSTTNLIKMALLSVIAAILMRLGIKLPALFPAFLEIDFSDVPAIVAVLTMHPASGVVVVVMKNLLKSILFGTSTMYVGELANLLTSIGYLLPLIFLTKKDKRFKKVMLGICLGTLGLTIAGAFVNYFITLPFYTKVMGISMESLVEMGNRIYSGITDKGTLILFSFVPFNLLKGGIVSTVSVLFVKAIYPLLGVLRSKTSE